MTPCAGPTDAQEAAVLRAVIYASLFDYPLTLDELREGLVGVSVGRDELARWCRTGALLAATVEERDGLYFPRGRQDLLAVRRRREIVGRGLLHSHRRMLRWLSALPFVSMMALSGSLAHLNAEPEGDVDLFVITRPGRVWTVTVAAIVMARACRWRRRLCLNYVTSERRLQIEPGDLFAANQVVHLRPLTGGAVYRRFLAVNPFVGDLYPNFQPRPVWPLIPARRHPRAGALVERALDATVAPAVERLCRAGYGWHLRRRSPHWQSREHVRLEPECLKLHTSSHRASIRARFDRAMAAALAAAPAHAPAYAPALRTPAP